MQIAASSDDDSSVDSSRQSFLPDGQDPRAYSQQSRRSSKESRPKSKQSRATDQNSDANRGVLSDRATKNRQQRRVESASTMGGGKGSGKRSAMQKELEEMRALLAEKEKENSEQKAQFQAQLAQVSTKRRKKYSASFPLSDEMKKLVIAVAGSSLWRTCKFLVTKEQLWVATEEVMMDIPEAKKLVMDVENKDDNIEAFANTYGDEICKVINNKRSNAQSGLKKAFLDRAANGLTFPDPDQLLAIVKRKGLDFDANDPAKNAQAREWFMWYWECLLPKVGGIDRWGYSIRNFGLISEHAPKNDSHTKFITSSDEALVVTLYENCGQRFPYLAHCQAMKTEHDQQHKSYQSKYSDSHSGQSKWGGWSAAGRKRYKVLRKAISISKRRDHVRDVEARCLVDLQAKYKIGVATASKKKGRIPKDYENNEECVADFGYESDDLEEEEGASSDVEAFVAEYQAVPKPKGANRSGSDTD